MIAILFSLNYDERKFVEKLYKELNLKMYKTAFNIFKNKTDAEEATAQAFVKIMENIQTIMKLSSPQIHPYCVTIVKNESVNIIRKRKNLVKTEDIDAFSEFADATSIELEFILNSDLELLIKAIDKLMEEDRELIVLYYVKNLGYKQIGEILGITEEAAKKRGQRIIQKLRKHYGEGEKYEK